MLERDVRRSGCARRRQCAVIHITYIKSVADSGRGGARSGSSETIGQRHTISVMERIMSKNESMNKS